MSTFYIRFSAHGPGVPRRSPLLERLLLRAAPAATGVDWRREAFSIIAPGVDLPPVAGAALAAVGGSPGQWVCVASPVHCIAGMTAVTLPRNGCLTLVPEEAASLAADFNRTFADGGVRLMVGQAGVLLATFPRPLDVQTRDPESAAGGDVFDFQPSGRDGPVLRRLTSEMEMWLFEHPVNRARTATGLLPVTGLWLWGGGAVPAPPPVPSGWTAGRDPLFAAYGDAAGFPSSGNAGVLVSADTPGSDSWSAIERRWLAPAIAALRAGRLQRLDLCAGARRCGVAGGRHWRLWRRPRPWWEVFDE